MKNLQANLNKAMDMFNIKVEQVTVENGLSEADKAITQEILNNLDAVESVNVKEVVVEPVEEWRDIEGYENLYQVSSFGRVKSLRKSQIIKLRKDYKEDLWGLYLHKNGKKEWHTIQYLVLKTFVGTPNDGNNYVMLHLDGHKDNNRLDNLIWADELNDIPVCCITTRTIYESATVAQEIDDYNPKAIVRSCNGPNQHAGRLEDGTKCKWTFIPKKYYDERLKGHRVIKAVESK